MLADRSRILLMLASLVFMISASYGEGTIVQTRRGGELHFTNIAGAPDLSPAPTPRSGQTQKAVSRSLEQRRKAIEPVLHKMARRNRLNPALVRAVVEVESGYNVDARSPKGAIGLMQLMPATARQYGVQNPYVAEENLSGGCRYLRALLDRYDDDLNLALAAYNAGPTAVDKHGGIPAYPETREYIRRVRERLESQHEGRNQLALGQPVRMTRGPDGSLQLVN